MHHDIVAVAESLGRHASETLGDHVAVRSQDVDGITVDEGARDRGDAHAQQAPSVVLEGLQGASALRFASAAASVCVGRKGAMPSLPSRDELAPLLE